MLSCSLRRSFTFDGVTSEDATQDQIFQQVAVPLLPSPRRFFLVFVEVREEG